MPSSFDVVYKDGPGRFTMPSAVATGTDQETGPSIDNFRINKLIYGARICRFVTHPSAKCTRHGDLE